MPFAKCLFLVILVVAALAATQSPADELPPKVVEFFRSRDRWLAERVIDDLPPLQLEKSQTRVRDALTDQGARLTDSKAKLEPIERRIEKNKSNPSMTALVKKDEARAKELKDAIQRSEERIAELRAELPAEEEQARAAEAEWHRRRPELVKAKLLEQRVDLTLMPPGKGALSPGHLQVGDVGLLPQWPVVIVNGVPVEHRWPVSVENLPPEWQARFRTIVDGQVSPARQRDALESHGGSSVAKNRHNLRVIQVIDEHRLLVSFIGGSQFDWPTFIWDGGDTGNYGDDSTLRVDSLVMVAGTMRYTSANGVGRTVFVLKPVDVGQLPTYSVEPTSVPSARLGDKPSPREKEAPTRRLDLDVLEVGASGTLPQWPVGHRVRGAPSFPPIDVFRQCAEQLSELEDMKRFAITLHGKPTGYNWKGLKPYIDHFGGVGVARDRCNVLVVQVLDERRIFVTFTGSEVPASWPLLVLDIGDTSDLADGATLRVSEPVEVVATERYEAVSGKSPIRYVLKVMSE